MLTGPRYAEKVNEVIVFENWKCAGTPIGILVGRMNFPIKFQLFIGSVENLEVNNVGQGFVHYLSVNKQKWKLCSVFPKWPKCQIKNFELGAPFFR